MSNLNCLNCAAETNGVVLCGLCQRTVRSALDNIATDHGDLLSVGAQKNVRVRRSGISDPTGNAVARTSAEKDPADLAAAEAKAELVGWCRMLQDDRDVELPRDVVIELTRHLTRHLRSIATLEWAGEFARQTLHLEWRLHRIISRSRGRWYAGVCSAVITPEMPHDGMSCGCGCHVGLDLPCDVPGGCGLEFVVMEAEQCERDLYAEPGANAVRCPECKTMHRVSERRAILLAEAEDVLLPLTTIAAACSALLDEEPSVARLLRRIRKWADRGDLVWSDHDSGVRLYRVGDVLDLHARLASNPNGRHGWRKVC